MSGNQTQINIYARNYIQDIFETRLCEEGFVCPDDKYLCWYRVKGHEVLHTLIFCSSWSQTPLMMNIGYEAVPFFVDPMYTKNVHFPANSHIRHDCFRRTAILEAGAFRGANLMPYREDVPVLAPGHGSRGLYTFDEMILPLLNETVSVEACYLMHKQYHLDHDTRFGGTLFADASREFIDEAVYLDDTEIYSYCRKRIENALKMYRGLVWRKPRDQMLKDILHHWEQLHAALFDDAREAYVRTLEARKNRNIQHLREQFGLPFS